MARYIFLLSVVLFNNHCFAQREFGVCDSTSYALNADTTIIAGRHHLYLYSNNTLSTLYDFTSPDDREYIRDFDIIHPDLWYTVVGSRYIGGPTRLYKSTNGGQIWTLDTSHHNAANSGFLSPQFFQSINNLQHLNGDTLMMFMSYYESGIIYSTDLGLTWTKWFHNLISYYQGMFECNDKYYIFRYQGDGFRASMFGFDKNLLFTSDSTGLWNSFNHLGYHPPCYNGADLERCIFAPHNSTRCESYYYFENKIDTLCSALSIEDVNTIVYRVFPNPFHEKITVEGDTGTEYYSLINVYGQTAWSGRLIAQQDFFRLTNGVYFLTISKGDFSQTIQLIKY